MAPSFSNPELEARIGANREDLASYLVYSDWLIERGDPRGELIAVQAKLRERPGDAAIVATEMRLLADHGRAWLGPFHGRSSDHAAFRWRLGFLDAVRLGPPLEEYETSEPDLPAMIEELKDIPSIAFLREIVVGSKPSDDYPTSWQDVIDAMVEHGLPPRVERLVFDCGGYWDISSTSLGDLSRLYPHLADLRELRIRMGAMTFGAIDLPALRSLEIETSGLTAENVRSISAAPWPSLERLSLCIGESDNDYGCDVQLEDLRAILEGANLERVKHLGLANTSLADALAAELVGARILPQLESLDLSRGTFGDQGAETLLRNAERFRHLHTIDLTHNYVGAELRAELERLGPQIMLGHPQESDRDGDTEYRYVQISE